MANRQERDENTTNRDRTCCSFDGLGLRPLVGDEPIDLCEVIQQRYERGSTKQAGSARGWKRTSL